MAGVTNGALAQFATTTTVALELEPGMPREAWEELGETLRAIELGVRWWLGGWWRYGERTYGESASQAAPTGLALKTVQNAAWVSGRIEPSRRREGLSVSHHEQVARMEDPDEQDRWLDKAEADQWSVAEMRGRIKAAERAIDMPTEAVKLLRRAVDAFLADPDTANAGRQDFLDLAEAAWDHVHHLDDIARVQPQ